MNNIEWNKTIEINGLTIPVKVTISAEEDAYYDLSDWDDEEDRKRIKNGDLFIACVVVKAFALGLTGYDSLGGCGLRPNNLFNHRPFGLDLITILEENGMVEKSLKDLKNQIIELADALKPYARENT